MSRRPALLLATALATTTVLAPVLASPSSAAPPAALPPTASDTGRGHAHSHGPDGLELDRGRPGSTVVGQPVDDALRGPWSTVDPLPKVSTDQPDRLDGLPSVHLVYLYPADLKTPRTELLNMFEADARAAQTFLRGTHGRSVRFDEAVPSSGSTVRLDITTVRSRYKATALGGSRQFDLVKDDLSRAFPDSTGVRKKYIAWLDAPSRYCGQGELYGDWHRDRENANDLRTTGVVYRPYDSRNPDGGFCRGRTLLHELGHNLGALDSGAPNAFDGAHCDDDRNDVMCYRASATFDSSLAPTSSPGEFDWGNDDYWDAGATAGSVNAGSPDSGAHLQHLNWWTVNLSRFICRPAQPGADPDCADPSTVHPTLDEFRYRSGDEAYPAPPARPTT